MRIIFAVVLALVVWPTGARADQLMCNERAVAETAAAMLPEGAVILDYCSQCDDKVRVVRVRTAAAVQGCQWELEVGGRVLWESERRYVGGYKSTGARYRRDGSRYLRRLDLAYVYIEVAPNDFRWFGGQLGLQAAVKTPAIQLPKVVSIAIGHRRTAGPPSLSAPPPPSGPPSSSPPSSSPPSQPAPPPADSSAPQSVTTPAASDKLTSAMVAQLFDFWRGGTGDPVLAHFIACKKLDLAKKSPTRYECVEPVEGPVAPGTQVFGWADWLVPRGANFTDVSIEFIYGGDVRLRRLLPVRGRNVSPVVPTTAGAKLSKRGVYTLRLIHGDKILRDVKVEVR